MLLIFTPEDGPKQEFPFHPGKLFSFEAELLEESGGTSWSTFREYGEKFMDGHFKARRAALWICLRRTDPKLRLSDLAVRVQELSVIYDNDELDRMIKAINNDPDLSDEERAEAIASVEDARVPPPGAPLGKDESADTPTNSESLEPATEPSPSNGDGQ